MAKSPVRIHAVNLDLNEFSGPAYQATLLSFLGDKYRDVPIGVLVAVGSSALALAMEVRAAHWPDTPIVFVAADEDSVAKIVGAAGAGAMTGRTLRFSLSGLIETARALVPGLKQIALVGDPLEKQPFRRHFREQLQRLAQDLAVIDLTGLPLADVKKRVAALPSDSAILYTAMTQDGAGTTYLPYEVVQAIAEVANRPIIVDLDNRIGRGGTGGPVVRPALLGEEAAQLVLRIFGGEAASQIPIEASDAMRPVFDWRELSRWGVSEAGLPPGSEIRFREFSVWEQYRTEIALVIITMLFQSGLIAVLLYEDRLRRLAEARSLELSLELAHVNRMATAGELAATIAHEIRQPLSAIVARGSAGLNWLKKETPDIDKVRSALENIVDNGHRADQVLRNTRAMFGKGDAPQESLNVNVVIRDVLALISAKLAENSVSLLTSYAEDPPPIVRANRVQLQQVLLNLTMNAIEAMSGVRDAPRILTLATEISRPGHVLIMVRDSGPGIAADQIDVIFKSFFTTKPEGMGVGLSVCKTIIEAHGGELKAIRGHPTGMVFTIDLPLRVKRGRPQVNDMAVSDATGGPIKSDLTKSDLTKSDAA
jgi:signal transduction histidine kinase